jgi:hypothetical protein
MSDAISEEAWRAAWAAKRASLPQSRDEGEAEIATIKAAVLAEREECARAAEGFERNRDWVPGSLYETLRREVAAAIRNRKAP